MLDINKQKMHNKTMSLITTKPNITIPEFQVTQSKTTYRVYLDPEEEGCFVVTSPDLNALVTQGKNEVQAIKNAYEAVQLLLEDGGSSKEDFNLLVVDR
jgi:predicted RNase H-like HicB family nuclease